MLSLIICSRQLFDFERVQQNIAATVGIPYQVIRIDNSKNNYSISKAYNEGARRSKYPFLCFLHEDVAFHSVDWGKSLLTLLEQKVIGLVGVAGGVLKTKATGPTWWSPLENSARLHLIQANAKGEKRTLYENPFQETYSQAVTLDGVFLACRKEVWQEIPFDEETIKGFHFYDLDFSLSIGQHYQVVVTYDILLAHFSEGKNDRTWAEQADIVMEKWRDGLPQASQDIKEEHLQQAEKQTSDFYLELLFQLHCAKGLQLKYIWRRFLAFPTDKLNIYYLKKWIKG